MREVPEEHRAGRFFLWSPSGGLMIDAVDPLNASRSKLSLTEFSMHFGAGNGVDVVLWGGGNVGVFERICEPRV